MKLKYNLIAWSLLGFFAAACDPMDDIYNEPNFRKRMKSEIAMHFLVSLLSLHCVLVKRRCQRSTLLHNFPLPHEAT